jgi:hypothetical protein
LAKGGALLEETRILLREWAPGEPETALAERVLKTDALGRATARRVLDIVRVFSLRFLQPTDQAARLLRPLVDAAPPAFLNDLLLLYTVYKDPLLRDFVANVYWPAVRQGRLVMTNKDVMHLIRAAELDGRIETPWSEEIRRDMCGRVMIALTDFGLLKPVRPAVRDVASYRPHDWTLVYVAYLLHHRGVSDGNLLYANEWSWFGLLPEEAWQHLSLIGADGWFIMQQAGDVRRISWPFASIEDVVHEFTRR